jgi:hypothetical protein
MESNIQFIDGNIDEQIDYYDESLYQIQWKNYDYPRSDNRFPAYREDGSGYYPDVDWIKERTGQRFIYLEITNDSGSPKQLRINTILTNDSAPRGEDRLMLIIESGMSITHRIDYLFYKLGGIEVIVFDINRFQFTDHIIFIRIVGDDTRLNSIELKLKPNGHERTYNYRSV